MVHYLFWLLVGLALLFVANLVATLAKDAWGETRIYRGLFTVLAITLCGWSTVSTCQLAGAVTQSIYGDAVVSARVKESARLEAVREKRDIPVEAPSKRSAVTQVPVSTLSEDIGFGLVMGWLMAALVLAVGAALTLAFTFSLTAYSLGSIDAKWEMRRESIHGRLIRIGHYEYSLRGDTTQCRLAWMGVYSVTAVLVAVAAAVALAVYSAMFGIVVLVVKGDLVKIWVLWSNLFQRVEQHVTASDPERTTNQSIEGITIAIWGVRISPAVCLIMALVIDLCVHGAPRWFIFCMLVLLGCAISDAVISRRQGKAVLKGGVLLDGPTVEAVVGAVGNSLERVWNGKDASKPRGLKHTLDTLHRVVCPDLHCK